MGEMVHIQNRLIGERKLYFFVASGPCRAS